MKILLNDVLELTDEDTQIKDRLTLILHNENDKINKITVDVHELRAAVQAFAYKMEDTLPI
jgi:hypothetical protein